MTEFEENVQEVIKTFGPSRANKRFVNGKGEECVIMDCYEQEKFIYLAGNQCAPLNYEWLGHCAVLNVPDIEEKIHTDNGLGETIATAAIGALFGIFAFHNKTTKRVERIVHNQFFISIDLLDAPESKFAISLGNQERLAYEIEAFINEIKRNYIADLQSPANLEDAKVCFLDKDKQKIGEEPFLSEAPKGTTVKVEIKYIKASPLFAKISENYRNIIYEAYAGCIKYVEIPEEEWNSAIKRYFKDKADNERIYRTAELNNRGNELEKEGRIEEAAAVYEENIKQGCTATFAYRRLVIIYEKLKRIDDLKRICILGHDKFPQDGYYTKKLDKLMGNDKGIIYPTQAIPCNPRRFYGKELEEEILKLPEFDFYNEQSKDVERPSYGEDFNKVREIQKHFRELLQEAEFEEDHRNLAKAAAIYEQMIAEEYWATAAYDKLIKIYGKANLPKEEIRVLQTSIDFFTKRHNKQLEYIRYLAQKHHAVDFCEQRIKENKRITYYNGAFELYNPHTILDAWKKKLEKKMAKTNP